MTAGHGVFTISCPEAVWKTLQSTEETKDQYFSGNRILETCKQEQHRLGWFSSNILSGMTHYSGNVRLPDMEYLRFRVRKLAESFKVINTSIPGAELTKIHTTVEIVKVSAI